MAKREPECMPCRGTGQVVSNLGGESRKLPCPWCQGTGVRTPDIDAQEPWLEGGGSGGDGKASVEIGA
jgi:DnaJ-class molecular chaperone